MEYKTNYIDIFYSKTKRDYLKQNGVRYENR